MSSLQCFKLTSTSTKNVCVEWRNLSGMSKKNGVLSNIQKKYKKSTSTATLEPITHYYEDRIERNDKVDCGWQLELLGSINMTFGHDED